jgi:pimeloyl-ACP methyl ester carboxylesterase
MFHQLPLAEELVGSSRKATEVYLRHFLEHWSYDASHWTEEDVERYVEASSQPGALRGGFNCYRAILRSMGRADPISDPKVHAPTLIFWAENDPIFPHAWSDNVADFYPNAELRSIPECGHFAFREKPDMVNRAIAEFISS